MRQRGSTLIELIVAMALFLVLIGLIFSFFRFGTRSFAQANSKQGLQLDAIKVVENLQRELKRSHFSSSTPIYGSSRNMIVDGETVHRDVLCFAGLKDWNTITDSNNFDQVTGAPLWNRYWVYYATKEPEGRLIKTKVEPNPPPEAPARLPLADLERLYYDDPSLNSFDGINPDYVALTKNVLSFKVSDRPRGQSEAPPVEIPEGSIEIDLKLREKHKTGAVEPGARREYDYYEIKLSVRPENTFPNAI